MRRRVGKGVVKGSGKRGRGEKGWFTNRGRRREKMSRIKQEWRRGKRRRWKRRRLGGIRRRVGRTDEGKEAREEGDGNDGKGFCRAIEGGEESKRRGIDRMKGEGKGWED